MLDRRRPRRALGLTIIGKIKRWTRGLVIPPFRAYVRYFPVSLGKATLWHLVGSQIEWADHRFVGPTTFGARMAGNTSDYVQRHVYYFGTWEPSLTHLITRCLRPGDVFVDVGANAGYYTLLASRLVRPNGHVLALEPAPAVFPLLQSNVVRDGAGNVRLMRLAAADRTSRVALFLSKGGNIGETTMIPSDAGRFQGDAESRPLCDILPREDLGRVRFIKIDVEGAEGLVIRGMEPILPLLRQDVIISLEFSPRRIEQLGTDGDTLFQTLRSHGFRAYALHNVYHVSTYLPKPIIRDPVPLEGIPSDQVDLVFTRHPL